MDTDIVSRNANISMEGVLLPAHYLAAGEGPPVVLLHGLGDSAYTWRWAMRPLARSRRVYAVSLPGYGNSAKPAVSYTPDFFLSFTRAFMDTLEIETASVVGHSLGGLIASRAALEMPDRINALSLVGSAGLGRKVNFGLRLLTVPGLDRLLIAWHRTFVGAYQWAFFTTLLLFANPMNAPKIWFESINRMARTPGYMEATVASAKSVSNIAGQRKNRRVLGRLGELNIPALVMWGDRDRVVPLRHAREAVARLRKGRLTIFRNCGHMPQIEAADEFATALEGFLGEISVTC